MFYSTEDFPAAQALTQGWKDILDDLENLEQNAFMMWPETNIYKGNWTAFPLYKFGSKVAENCLLCPKTTELIEKIPGMITAGFSSLAPGTHITPHVGYTTEVLRFHLGLKNSEDCAIRVGKDLRSWDPGTSFVFDDTVEHEAWNRGTKTRVILLLDFKRDPDKQVEFPAAVYSY